VINLKWYVFLAFIGIASAQVYIPIGECNTYELLNGSNETVCALIPAMLEISLNASDANNSSFINTTRGVSVSCVGNTTTQIISIINTTNITNVTNITYFCPPVSLNMYANSTTTINNATISCFGSVVNTTIPTNYCYENVLINPTDYSQVYRSDKCNITVVSPPDKPATSQCLPYQYLSPCVIPPGESCPAAEPVPCTSTCPECPFCPNAEPLRTAIMEANNTIISLSEKLNRTQNELDSKATIAEIIKQEVKDTTSPLLASMESQNEMNTNIAALIVFGGIGLLAAWKFVSVKGVVNSTYPANTEDSIAAKLDRLDKYEKGGL
jgi:hypothetical protein